MTSKDAHHENSTKVAKALVSAGVAAGSAALASGATPGVAAVIALGTSAVGLVADAADALFGRKRQQVERWWTEVAHRCGGNPDELRLLLEARIDEPYVHKTVVESVRGLLEAVCEEVSPALGALAAEYMTSGRQPDRFFRGFVRTLVDLDVDEFSTLKMTIASVFDFVGDQDESDRPPNVTLIAQRAGTLAVRRLTIARDIGSQQFGPPTILEASPHHRRLVQALFVAGLAYEPVDVLGGHEGQAVSIDNVTVRRMQKLLNA